MPQAAAAQLECTQELVVTLAVESGSTLATQTLQFSVPCINRRASSLVSLDDLRAFRPLPLPRVRSWDTCLRCHSRPSHAERSWSGCEGFSDASRCSPDGECPCTCDYASDASCTCRDVASPLNVTLTKTAATATYPLQYVQSFNAKPYEQIIMTGGRNAVSSCVDGALAAAPTCGWFKDASGANIVCVAHPLSGCLIAVTRFHVEERSLARSSETPISYALY